MTITEKQLDEIEQGLVKAALNGSAPAAKWVLANRRPEAWKLSPSGLPEHGELPAIMQAVVDVMNGTNN